MSRIDIRRFDLRGLATLLIALGQLAYLGSLAVDRERLLNSETHIHLRTAPVDPRDPFRGDYVTLRYDLNAVAADALRGDLAAHRDHKGRPAYATLERYPGSQDLYRLRHLTDQPPDDGLFVAGKLRRGWRRPAGGVAVSYDIEKLFVEQGKGLEIEERRGSRDGLQVPMEVEIALDERGRAAIRDYRWSPIGVSFEAERSDEHPAPKVRFTLHNVGDTARYLVDPGDHCSFAVIPADWGAAPWPSSHAGCGAASTPADLHRLEPGATYTVELDLNQPRWQLEYEGQSVTIDRIAEARRGTRFRIVYRPDPSGTAGLEPLERSGIVEQASPAFTASALID
ncbi:MAG: GDYXXLXY domain-containing protein [Acidobacteriota bacterium]